MTQFELLMCAAVLWINYILFNFTSAAVLISTDKFDENLNPQIESAIAKELVPPLDPHIIMNTSNSRDDEKSRGRSVGKETNRFKFERSKQSNFEKNNPVAIKTLSNTSPFGKESAVTFGDILSKENPTTDTGEEQLIVNTNHKDSIDIVDNIKSPMIANFPSDESLTNSDDSESDLSANQPSVSKENPRAFILSKGYHRLVILSPNQDDTDQDKEEKDIPSNGFSEPSNQLTQPEEPKDLSQNYSSTIILNQDSIQVRQIKPIFLNPKELTQLRHALAYRRQMPSRSQLGHFPLHASYDSNLSKQSSLREIYRQKFSHQSERVSKPRNLFPDFLRSSTESVRLTSEPTDLSLKTRHNSTNYAPNHSSSISYTQSSSNANQPSSSNLEPPQIRKISFPLAPAHPILTSSIYSNSKINDVIGPADIFYPVYGTLYVNARNSPNVTSRIHFIQTVPSSSYSMFNL